MQYIDLMDAAKKAFYSPIDYRNGWNDAVETMPRWFSVEERLPECNTDILVFAREGKNWWYGVAYLDTVGRWARNGGGTVSGVTHWMPLPEPPEEDDHGKK